MRLLTLTLLLATLATPQDTRALRPIDIGARKALVIGNSKYPPGADLGENPTRDALAMKKELEGLGFQVTVVLNASKRQMEEAVAALAERLGERDLALVYYAGHGVQVAGENYLIPVDFNGRTEADVKYNAYQASLLRETLEGTRARVRLLVFDACRNNPYRFRRDGARGLAPMTSNAEGTAIIFGAGDGQTADNSGVFTASLLTALRLPGLGLDQVFKRVQADVFAKSGGKQFPAVYDQIIGSLVLKAGSAILPMDDEPTYWQECRERKGEFCRIYLEKYPAGRFARLAQAYLSTTPDPVNPASIVSPPVPAARGQRAINPKDGLAYVRIPAGEFMMGCSPGDNECNFYERPPVRVVISRPFYLGETEVTQSAYRKVIGSNPSQFNGAELPVEQVTYVEASQYCTAIGGRLPTEAEWEWSARGGLPSARYGPADDIGWHLGNSGQRTHPVKSLRPNGYGLYDMLGNVREWTSTWFSDQPVGGTDPSGARSGKAKVLRGDSWKDEHKFLRASYRFFYEPSIRYMFNGFRCVWEQ